MIRLHPLGQLKQGLFSLVFILIILTWKKTLITK